MEDYNEETDPARTANANGKDNLVIEDWQISLIKQFDLGPRRAFKHVYGFVKNNQAMTSYDFQTMQASIRDIMAEQSVNCGILMFMHGTYVFTEQEVDLNPLMLKLATGINFNGEITSSVGNLNDVNSQLGR